MLFVSGVVNLACDIVKGLKKIQIVILCWQHVVDHTSTYYQNTKRKLSLVSSLTTWTAHIKKIKA